MDADSNLAEETHRLAAERRALARHPATTPVRLRELAAEVDALPRERQRFAAALAANPNVPTDLIARYLYLAPGDFCRNPTLDDWDLEAEFYRQFPHIRRYYQMRPAISANAKTPLPAQQAMLLGLGRLLRSPRVPRTLVSQIATRTKYPYLAAMAQLHVHAAGEIAPEAVEASLARYWADALAGEGDPELRRFLGRLFQRDLAPTTLRSLLPASLKLENVEFTGAGRWDSLLIGWWKWSDLIQKALDSDELFILQESAPAVLLYRTLALLRAPEALRLAKIRLFAESSLWHDRVAAALALRPFPGEDELRPRYRILLERLARDGNQYVRAVARRRITEPDWQFPYF